MKVFVQADGLSGRNTDPVSSVEDGLTSITARNQLSEVNTDTCCCLQTMFYYFMP